MTRILLVEDNETNRDMLRRRLERKGFDVVVAIDGAEGVAKAQTERPDIVLMDLNLPVLDGWEATRQIKANPQTQKIPVIALTANAIVGDREKALAAGCDEYDTKPVDFTRLLGKIDTLLQPSEVPLPKPLDPVPDVPGQAIAWTRLRHDLEQPIYTIVGYSDMLLDALVDQQNSAFASDLQKIHLSGLQLLKLIQAILNPALLEVQQQDWTADLLAPALRRELLTPLSTIMGYCELLLEESLSDLLPDLEQIHTSAQDLLSLVNNLDSLMARYLESSEERDRFDPLNFPRKQRKAIDPSIENSRVLVIAHAGSPVYRQLERQGYSVKNATTVGLGLASSFDLIVLDSQTDLNVLEQLKSHESWQHIPVLMIAAPDEMAQISQAIALGATDYLTKPFPTALLYAKVTACLEQARIRHQLAHYESIVEEFREYKRLEADLNQQLAALQVELEQIKRSHQATEIVQTDYFRQISSNAEPIELKPLKVLLVEDNDLNCDMLCRRLQRHGYEVVIATDGAEGVSKALSEQPQVILMDISLPVMDGWEATQHLKANAETRHIPIIALTAHAMTGDREKALASGCDDYDTKPIELPRLLSKIEDCLKSSTSK
ncbi:response regulator [Leptolyngbya sp. FACHB-1624]|uniref:response regulator n=1 Tax=Leptolyngbya TaxID=47251 RepID=UPI001685EA19|nr:response regulator [Leptolyngbya sp. FACHB-1624]MBD1855631.1 response regulator [Leptolyngbya sp. FACHB-1624]